MSIWKPNDEDRLARELRAARPEPRADFVRSLVDRIERRGRPRIARRLGLATALAAALLGVAASLGGLGDGASALGHVVRMASTHQSPHNAAATPASLLDPSADQYGEERKECLKTEAARHRAVEIALRGHDPQAHQAEAELHVRNVHTCLQLGS